MTLLDTVLLRKARDLRQAARSGLNCYAAGLKRRSVWIATSLSRNSRKLAMIWLAMFMPAAMLRLMFSASPVHNIGDSLALAVPYALIALAPLAGFVLASNCFPNGVICGQPDFRLSLYGKWRRLDVIEARRNPLFGPAGFMASLLVGLILNVGFRSFEFMLAVPPMNHHAPDWGLKLFHLMAADVVLMSFFYMVCFVMALRTIPLFPRMLLFAWGLDICLQLGIAHQIGTISDLPASVAAPLKSLLEGNINKVLISGFVWIPYLMLSERVNLTYRQRIRMP